MAIENPERIADRKQRLQIRHTPYPERDARERIDDFSEVVIGYDEETAMREASRCMQCPQPSICSKACPLGNDIPGALWLISQGDFIGAANIYRQTSIFPEICGRVCPQEKLCEGRMCVGQTFRIVVARQTRDVRRRLPARDRRLAQGRDCAADGETRRGRGRRTGRPGRGRDPRQTRARRHRA